MHPAEKPAPRLEPLPQDPGLAGVFARVAPARGSGIDDAELAAMTSV